MELLHCCYIRLLGLDLLVRLEAFLLDGTIDHVKTQSKKVACSADLMSENFNSNLGRLYCHATAS